MSENRNFTDLDLFNQLFSDYQERFVRFANSYVRDTAIAEDMTMESLMYYWENRKKLKDDTNVPAYILTTIKHKCINHLQHMQVKNAFSEHAAWELNLRISTLKAFEPNELFTTEIETIIKDTLASMPAQTRKIFVMSRYENKSHKEIAKLLNITTKGVEYHISKVLSALRVHLKDYLPLIAFFI